MPKHEEMNEILGRAEARQARAQEILDELDLINRWLPHGRPIVVGSVSTGLVVEPDIDMEVYADRPQIADGFRVMAAVAESERVVRIAFKNEFETRGAWLYWEIHYRDDDGVVWTIELYHSTPNAPYAGWMEQFAGAMQRVLTDEHRVAILSIKEVLCKQGTMRDTKSFYIYRAVIADGVRSFDEYTAWMAKHKPEGMMEWTPGAAGRCDHEPR
ncbi:MAG: hypothetical protein JW889_05160 [Verrucomicrobia bacterium]|nr:hypothetical protein [Verrucomicrobiota bacterium]